MKHLPLTIEEFKASNWDKADFVMVIGEAYVDHASFGHALIARVLENAGYKVAIISLPDYKNAESIAIYGEPRLGFLVTSGNIDSMVNHYTSAKKKRSTDSYAPNDEAGLRPDRATIVYSNLIRKIYKDTPIILGGVEASLRRFAHYDYWSNKVRHSILEDANADLLVYGMGERTIVEIADLLDKGVPVTSITTIKGTCWIAEDYPENAVKMESYEQVVNNKRDYAKCYMTQYRNSDPIYGKQLAQKQHRKIVVQNSPQLPLTTEEMDKVYELPYTRQAHPSYGQKGISALNEVKFSLTSSRGCFGSCSFCSIGLHQGRNIAARSQKSLIDEAKQLTTLKDFKGYIHDVGGPTANFRHSPCEKISSKGGCKDRMCLYPSPCKNLNTSHKDYMTLLRNLRKLDGVKKVFIRSGLRYDYILNDKDCNSIISEIARYHISGRLKIAPEHISENVLSAMGKPKKEKYITFISKYMNANKKAGMNQHVEPYFISSHPGSTLDDAIELACFMKEMNIQPKQVQDFYPTPSTISTCMYYTGYDPRTMKKIYVPTNEEKRQQRALLQFRDAKNYDLVMRALKRADRMDLVGFDKECLIRPRKSSGDKNTHNHKKGIANRQKGKNYATNNKSKSKSSNNGNSGSYKGKTKHRKKKRN